MMNQGCRAIIFLGNFAANPNRVGNKIILIFTVGSVGVLCGEGSTLVENPARKFVRCACLLLCNGACRLAAV